jgi:hypothetical protein
MMFGLPGTPSHNRCTAGTIPGTWNVVLVESHVIASEYWSMPPVFGYVPAITIDVDYISIDLIAVLDS